jgi:glycosyltransferase involved in cell wall biosynthesis
MGLPAEPVIHITEGMESELGGTTSFMRTLCRGLGQREYLVQIWTPKCNGNGAALDENGFSIHRFTIAPPKAFRRSSDLNRALFDLEPKPSLIHQHGLWLDMYRAAGRFAAGRGIPHVISLHGMLEPWCLRYRHWKKKLAWILFQRKALQSASCLQAATRREAENVRRLGIESPIAVIPNGVSTAESPVFSDLQELCPALMPIAGKKIVLFLGRLHPIKGLDFLCRVWAESARDEKEWHLLIVGPSEKAYRQKLGGLIRSLAIQDQVSLLDAVEEPLKSALIKTARFLVLPSYAESFGMVVLEALRAGTPVMASRNTPWADLEAEGCGWWINHNPHSWKKALREAMSLDFQSLHRMGEKGIKLVMSKYTDQNMIASFDHLYQWLLGLKDKPQYIV